MANRLCNFPSMHRNGPWGGNLGAAKDVTGVPRHLESITICSGSVIDSLEFSYISEDGQRHTKGPWGGDGGSRQTINLRPTEFIREVSGTYGRYEDDVVVRSLKIVTNMCTYGPFGREQSNGTSFCSNGTVVGFHGRCGEYLNLIGTYTVDGPWGGSGGRMDKHLGLGNESSPKEDEEGKKDDVDDDTSDLARAEVVLERAQQAETGAGNEWVLDTRSLVHHTFNLRLLLQPDLPSDQTLIVTVQELLAVAGESGGSVQTERFKVPDVRYIEGETRNVISVAQLARKHGLVTVFEPTCAYVRDLATGQDVGRAHLSNGIYVLDYLLVEQLNEGSVKAQCQGEAGGSCGGGGGGIGGSDGGKERKGGDGGGSGGTAGGQGRGGAGAAGEGHDEGREEERDDSGSGGQDGDDEMEELEESSQMQDGIFGQPRSDRVTTACVSSTSTNEPPGPRMRSFYVDSGAEHHHTWNHEILLPYPQQLGISTVIKSITGVCRGSEIEVRGIGYVDSAGGSLDRVLFVPDTDFKANIRTGIWTCKTLFRHCSSTVDRVEFKIEGGDQSSGEDSLIWSPSASSPRSTSPGCSSTPIRCGLRGSQPGIG